MAIETQARPIPLFVRASLDRKKEALTMATLLQNSEGPGVKPERDMKPEPNRVTQTEILNQAFGMRENLGNHLSETFGGRLYQGKTRGRIMTEYTTMTLARQYALEEVNIMRSGEGALSFYVHDSGLELAREAWASWTDNNDPNYPYYRGQTVFLHRGGTLEEMFAHDMHRVGDTSTRSRQLPGHYASEQANIIGPLSTTGANFPPAVGHARALEDDENKRIVIAETGDATMGQGEVMEAVTQAVMDESPVLFVVYNNRAGISMGLKDTSPNDDPIGFARSFHNNGLLVVDVEGTDLEALMEAGRKVVEYTRNERKPALLHVKDLHRVTDHTSSSTQSTFTAPDELERRQGFDRLGQYRDRLVQDGVATEEELETIDQLIKERVRAAGDQVKQRPVEDPKKLYEDVYAPEFKFGPRRVSGISIVPTIDHLQSTRTPGVKYMERRQTGVELKGREYVSLEIARALKRYPNAVVIGEDVAMITKEDWQSLSVDGPENYFYQRLRKYGDFLTDQQMSQAIRAFELVRLGQGYQADPESFATFSQIMEGKGGVFKNTQFGQWLFGERVSNYAIREAGIIGTAVGLATEGMLPLAEMQFDVYTANAFQQLHDQVSSLRWRTGGQFKAGMVIRVQGGNRIGGNGIDRPGGLGGLGHGMAEYLRFLVPGLRHFIAGTVEDLGTGLREAFRVAHEYGEPVIVWEPISLANEVGYDQDAAVPLGEAEVRRSGTDLVIPAWSTNVRIAEKVSDELAKEGLSVGVVNMRGIGDQTDWDTLVPEIIKAGRVLIPEAGRLDSRLVAGDIQQQCYRYLKRDSDISPVTVLPARYLPMAAGKENEAFTVPQYADVLSLARELILHDKPTSFFIQQYLDRY